MYQKPFEKRHFKNRLIDRLGGKKTMEGKSSVTRIYKIHLKSMVKESSSWQQKTSLETLDIIFIYLFLARLRCSFEVC